MKHFLIISGYLSSKNKEKTLLELLSKVSKIDDLTICYSTHHSNIPKKVYQYCDYVFYNKNNPILNWDYIDDFTKKFGNQMIFTMNNKNYKVRTYNPNHGYAHLLNMLDGISCGISTGHTTFTCMNYDVIDFCLEQLPGHIAELKKNSNLCAIFYPYDDGRKTKKYNTEFFSFNSQFAQKFYEYRDYNKFRNDVEMPIETLPKFIIDANNFNYMLLKMETWNLGKIPFADPEEDKSKLNDSWFVPIVDYDYKDDKKRILIYPFKPWNDKQRYLRVIKDSFDHIDPSNNKSDTMKKLQPSSRYDDEKIYIDDEEINFDETIKISDDCNFKFIVSDKILLNVRLKDPRQFGLLRPM